MARGLSAGIIAVHGKGLSPWFLRLIPGCVRIFLSRLHFSRTKRKIMLFRRLRGFDRAVSPPVRLFTLMSR